MKDNEVEITLEYPCGGVDVYTITKDVADIIKKIIEEE